jgi:putative tryptophan/tyrosine transport system substrate-binding protein
VFITGSDPVQDGLVASLNQPGGNATGVMLLSDPLHLKRLELRANWWPRAARSLCW